MTITAIILFCWLLGLANDYSILEQEFKKFKTEAIQAGFAEYKIIDENKTEFKWKGED